MSFPVLNVMELERPHRSGVLAVIITYALLGAVGELYGNYDSNQPMTMRSLFVCAVMPWDCLRQKPQHPQMDGDGR